MPVETFIQTGERTALSYLVKPISDQIMRAWRERLGPARTSFGLSMRLNDANWGLKVPFTKKSLAACDSEATDVWNSAQLKGFALV
jgi:hypothetical protein